MKLSILIPVYNDKDYIRRTIEQIRAVDFPIPYEIVAVDDASTDGSKEILESISGIKKIFHTKNTGKGGAIATGLNHVSGDIIAIQDDDCEYDPAALPLLIDPIIRGETDVVYGSRFLQKNAMFLIQRIENVAITTLANLLVGQKLSDIETGHKVFSRTIAEKINLTKKGFEFDMEITLQFIKNGARIKELPTSYTARTHAQGKKITYKDGIRSIVTLFRYTLGNGETQPSGTRAKIRRYAIPVAFLATVFLPRLIGFGNILTIDEPLWLSRGQTFINALSVGNFEKTLVAGQPGVTTAWLIGMSSPWQSLAAGQASIALATGVLILVITYFLRLLIGNRWGAITGIYLALDPFLLAHSRVAHTDALLALFYFASIVALLCGIQKKGLIRRYFVMSAALGAGAILTKIYGLILIPTIVLIITTNAWLQRQHFIHALRLTGLWIAIFTITIFIMWPALWFNADKVYSYMFSRSSIHAEGTRFEETTSAPWYYARETVFRLSVPTSILLVVALWQWRKGGMRNHARSTAVLCAAGIAFAAILSLGSDKSDRYILFTHVALTATAPLGLRSIAEYVANKPALPKWPLYITGLVLLYLAVDDIRLHPYYLAHYNRLYPIETEHKLGWGEGLEQAAQWISDHAKGASVLSYYSRVFDYFYDGDVEKITHINDANADYAVLYRSMFERGTNSEEAEIINEFMKNPTIRNVHTVVINGLPYAWIYKLGNGIR